MAESANSEGISNFTQYREPTDNISVHSDESTPDFSPGSDMLQNLNAQISQYNQWQKVHAKQSQFLQQPLSTVLKASALPNISNDTSAIKSFPLTTQFDKTSLNEIEFHHMKTVQPQLDQISQLIQILSQNVSTLLASSNKSNNNTGLSPHFQDLKIQDNSHSSLDNPTQTFHQSVVAPSKQFVSLLESTPPKGTTLNPTVNSQQSQSPRCKSCGGHEIEFPLPQNTVTQPIVPVHNSTTQISNPSPICHSLSQSVPLDMTPMMNLLRASNNLIIPIPQFKFSGNYTESPEQFLESVTAYAAAYSILPSDMLKFMDTILKGSAFYWWKRHHHLIADWTSFSYYFRTTFVTKDRQLDIQHRIHDRKQRPQESFDTFVTDILDLYHQLTKPPSDDMIIQTIIRNTLPVNAPFLTIVPTDSLEDFRARARAVVATIPTTTPGSLRYAPPGSPPYCSRCRSYGHKTPQCRISLYTPNNSYRGSGNSYRRPSQPNQRTFSNRSYGYNPSYRPTYNNNNNTTSYSTDQNIPVTNSQRPVEPTRQFPPLQPSACTICNQLGHDRHTCPRAATIPKTLQEN